MLLLGVNSWSPDCLQPSGLLNAIQALDLLHEAISRSESESSMASLLRLRTTRGEAWADRAGRDVSSALRVGSVMWTR